ncbi:glycerophosphodiester phosphodiesterase [Roseibium litorale]|uniref:GP-PDE domain-containing protein n=1 Tax=Roseibium litorale TaxID=2803841 RepID=A0ABR9CVF7_9HYPH|nr:glycerophosphodiester phosphodiesterase family protein [Roseibium litorale]MBD8894131.1 hypothetical protein [Roseibium litorale]
MAWLTSGRPLAIAHRGASAYAPDNTLAAFALADVLGADMWEVDIQLSSDGVAVVCHDSDLNAVAGLDEPVSSLPAEALTALATLSGEPVPLFGRVVELAQAKGAALYLDVKNSAAYEAALSVLQQADFTRAVFGINDAAFCRKLIDEGCPYPVSILFGIGKDPFEMAELSGADILHPCWERAGGRPDQLLTPAFFAEAQRRGLPVVTWHEERPDVAAALLELPVAGICSDTPQLLKSYRHRFPEAPKVVCHRGACAIAPENTLASAHAAFAAGFHVVELDVHQLADGSLAVIHDGTLDRTTDGTGPVAEQTSDSLQDLDAGSWFSRHYTGEPVPFLSELLTCASIWSGQLYIELKETDPAAVLAEVDRHDFFESCFFWSFNASYLRQMKALEPRARFMARREDYNSIEACLEDLSPVIVEFNQDNLDPVDLDKVRACGKKVMIAYMGRDREIQERIRALRPDLVNINDLFGWSKLIETAAAN